jgi:signal transduction histidine kinase
MIDTEIYTYLEKGFTGTFLNELMPGIFHNFANPLNGIMGRSKLMQRRMDEFVKKIETRYPGIEEEMGADYKKLAYDINTIYNESERFFDMFRTTTGKFYSLGEKSVEMLNLSALIETELAFANFYMDYKHNTQKDILIDKSLPYIEGIAAFYSIALWVLIRQATRNIQKKKDETLHVETAHDDQWIIVVISHIGGSLVQGWQDIVLKMDQTPDSLTRCPEEEKNLIYALTLFRHGGRQVEMTNDIDADRFTIRISYRSKSEA